MLSTLVSVHFNPKVLTKRICSTVNILFSWWSISLFLWPHNVWVRADIVRRNWILVTPKVQVTCQLNFVKCLIALHSLLAKLTYQPPSTHVLMRYLREGGGGGEGRRTLQNNLNDVWCSESCKLRLLNLKYNSGFHTALDVSTVGILVTPSLCLNQIQI